MAKKPPKTDARQPDESPSQSVIQHSAQQIWLAGLGAFSKAQKQGDKVFETLVKDGLALQHKTQEATQKNHPQDKLETIFEDRVAKALSKLGIPSAAEMNTLLTRLDQLNKRVQKMDAARPTKSPTTPKRLKTPKSG